MSAAPTRGRRLVARARSIVEARLPMPITHVVPVRHHETAPWSRRRRKVVAGVSLLGTGLLGAVAVGEAGLAARSTG